MISLEDKPTALSPYFFFFFCVSKEVSSGLGIATYGREQTQAVNTGFMGTYCY